MDIIISLPGEKKFHSWNIFTELFGSKNSKCVPKELHRPASEIPDPFQICSQYLMRTHGCVSVGVITVFVSPLTELFAAAAAAGQHHY